MSKAAEYLEAEAIAVYLRAADINSAESAKQGWASAAAVLERAAAEVRTEFAVARDLTRSGRDD